MSQTAIAIEFGCQQAAISKIIKKKDAILAAVNSGSKANHKCIGVLKAPRVDEIMLQWFNRCLKKKAIINGIVIMRQANRVAEKLQIEFATSTGWLKGFLRRNKIAKKKLSDFLIGFVTRSKRYKSSALQLFFRCGK